MITPEDEDAVKLFAILYNNKVATLKLWTKIRSDWSAVIICWVGLALSVLWWVLSAKSLLTGSKGP
jgi:hypothetical protein